MGDEEMQKQNLSNAVSTLIKHHKNPDLPERQDFYLILEACCDRTSPYYLLNDIETLAEVIRERNATFLVEQIAKYDAIAAQNLDGHIRLRDIYEGR
jgi:hypothetical protein